MNAYSPSGSRGVIVFLLTISVLLTGSVHSALSAVNLEFQWLIDAFSAVLIYRILYYAFDRFIWKWSPLRNLGLVAVPNLNGKWQGHLTSSYTSDNRSHSISVVITQQWSKISIQLEAEESHSRSVAASFLTDNPKSPELVYVYENVPESMKHKSMQIHGGTARLRLTDSTLRGQYYTGRGRETIGNIVLERSKDNITSQ